MIIIHEFEEDGIPDTLSYIFAIDWRRLTLISLFYHFIAFFQ